MLRTLVTTVCLAASWCSLSHGGQITVEAIDTPGLPGFQTHTLSYQADAGESFRGFNATFTGTINQVNPFGILATIFQDNNGLFSNPAVDKPVEQDSQFLFQSTEVLSIGAEEGAGILKAAISGLVALDPPLTNPTAFAQIVTNCPVDVHLRLEVDNGAGGESFFGVLGYHNCIPEPVSGVMVELALATLIGRCRLRNGRH